MPNGFISRRDSIGSYSNQWDMTNAGNSPFEAQMRRRRMNMERESLDDMETDRAKIERQMLQRFRDMNFRLSNNRMYFVYQAGRFLFLTATLPPYMVFIGGPRWIFLKGIPLVLRKLHNILSPAIKLLMRIRNLTAKMLGQILSIFAKQANRVKNLLDACQNILAKIADKTIGNAARAIVKGVQTFAKQLLRIIEAPKRFLQAVGKMLQYVGTHLQNTPIKVWNVLLNGMKQAGAKVITNVKQTFAPAVKATAFVKNTYQAGKQAASDVFRGAQTLATKTGKLIADTGRFMRDHASRAMNGAANRIAQAVKPVKEWLTPKIQANTGRINDVKKFVKERANDLKERIQKTTDAGKKYVKEKVEDLGNLAMKVIQNSAATALAPFLHLFNKDNAARKAGHEVISGLKFIKKKLKSFKEKLAYLTGIFSNAGKGVKDIILQLSRSFWKFPNFLIRLITLLMKALGFFIKDFLIGINVLIAAIHLIFVQARLLLRTKTSDFGDWLRYQQVGHD